MPRDITKMPDFFRTCIDAFPSPVFVVDDDVRIQFANSAALPLLGKNPERAFKHRGGEVLHCVHASETPEGCGHAAACKACVVRNSVNAAFSGTKTTRNITKMMLENKGQRTELYLLITTAPLQHEGQQLAILVLEDINELINLRHILPICARCKKIRDDSEYWADVEAYFNKHLAVDFSHGICPDCFKTLYPEYVEDEKGKSSPQS